MTAGRGLYDKCSSFKIGARVQKAFYDEATDKVKMYKGKVAKRITRGEDSDSENVLLNEIEYMLCVL